MTQPTLKQINEAIRQWRATGVLELHPEVITCTLCIEPLATLETMSAYEISSGVVGFLNATLFECPLCQQRYFKTNGGLAAP